MRTFEFHAYAGDADGNVAEKADVTYKEFTETARAKAHAGRLAKRVNGPVDLARSYDPPEQPVRDWSNRYITTARPSEFHSSGYALERLS